MRDVSINLGANLGNAYVITTTGHHTLQETLTRFAREARADSPSGWMQGVRLSAAFIAESLAKRTLVAKPNHPKFRKADEMDIVAIGQFRGMSNKDIQIAWKMIDKQGGAYVGMRGFTDKRTGLPYKPQTWASARADKNLNGAGTSIRELNKRWQYQYAGLAKAAWMTMKQQTKRVPKMGAFQDKIAAVLPKIAVVWVRPENLSIHFWNRLSYADKATTQTAIREAMDAGVRRMVGYTEAQIKKQMEKYGL